MYLAGLPVTYSINAANAAALHIAADWPIEKHICFVAQLLDVGTKTAAVQSAAATNGQRLQQYLIKMVSNYLRTSFNHSLFTPANRARRPRERRFVQRWTGLPNVSRC
jgi:hypothetical protein